MTSRNKGQLRIGKSGPVIIESAIQESPIQAKVGQSGPIVVGQQNTKNLNKEGNFSSQDKERIEKDKERLEKDKERIEKDKERIEKDKEYVRRKWLDHINKCKHSD